jgi:hypothetical protein
MDGAPDASVAEEADAKAGADEAARENAMLKPARNTGRIAIKRRNTYLVFIRPSRQMHLSSYT